MNLFSRIDRSADLVNGMAERLGFGLSDRIAAAPDTDVVKSSPVMPRATDKTPSDTMKKTKNAMTEFKTSSPTGRPS